MSKDQVTSVCLCGSTRFKESYIEAAKNETFAGHIVLMSPVFSQADGEKLTEEQVETLNRVHRQKIRLCDEVLIVNRFGYVGESTQEEIEFAQEQKKKVRLLEPDDFTQELSELTDNEIWFALEDPKLTSRTQEICDLIRSLHDRHVLKSVTEKFREAPDNSHIRWHFAAVDANWQAGNLIDAYELNEENENPSLNEEIITIEARELFHVTNPLLNNGLEAPEEFASEWFVVSKEFAAVAEKIGEFIDISSMGSIWGRRPSGSHFSYGEHAYVEPAIIPILKQLTI